MKTQLIAALVLSVLTGGCAGVGSAPSGKPSQTGGTQPASRPLDAQQAERLRLIMVPVLNYCLKTGGVLMAMVQLGG